MKKETEKKLNTSGKILIFAILFLLAIGGDFAWRHFKKSEVPAVFGKLEIASDRAECVIPNEKFTVTIRAVSDKGITFNNCLITAAAAGSSAPPFHAAPSSTSTAADGPRRRRASGPCCNSFDART